MSWVTASQPASPAPITCTGEIVIYSLLPFLVVVVFFVTVVFFAVAVFLAVVALVAVVFFAAVVLVAVVFLAVVFLAAVVFLVAVVLASVVFAAAVLEAYAGLALEHSGLLQNLRLLPLRSTCSTIIAPQSGHFSLSGLSQVV